MLVFWTPSVAPQWHLIELKENTIQYKFWSFHHQNTGSLCYYYEKEFNYFLFGKYHLQGNNKVVAVWGDKRVACNSFVWSLLLLEALFHLKTVFQITVSETRLVSSKGNSKRQLRKEWGISTSSGGYPEAVSWHETIGIWREQNCLLISKPNFSTWNVCKGEICLFRFLGYFMPCPCICESHGAKKTFDCNKLERLKS